jgi:hypothetical protein
MLIEKKIAKYWNLKMHRAVEKIWRTLLQPVPCNSFLMQPPPLYHDQASAMRLAINFHIGSGKEC